MDALLTGLNIARQKLRLLVDLFDGAVENLFREGIDANFGFLADLDAADFGFGNVDAHINLIALEKGCHGRVRRDEVARADVQDFHGCGRRSSNLALAVAGLVIGVGRLGKLDVLTAIAALEFFERGLSLLVTGLGGGNFLGAIATLELVQLLLGGFALGQRDLPIRFCGVALLLGDEILLGKRFIAVKIEMRADFVGLGAFEISLCCGDVLLAVTVFFQLVIGLGLLGGRAGFRDFFRTIAALGLHRVGTRLFQGGLQFLFIKGEQNLSGLNGITFSDQDFVDAAANFRAHPNVACFDGTGAVQGGVAMEPAGVERRRGQHRGADENDRDVLAIHELRS